ncbi:MAG: hypothetical protein Q9M91_03650 [Candidatus Dojkabacteria bacterium]|nr:hypothetical protein [Candidatus Dojkabacteria bacterium]MDQ7020911.1 hypothetical protein [Candidatus Dojkabacteria bacterium]
MQLLTQSSKKARELKENGKLDLQILDLAQALAEQGFIYSGAHVICDKDEQKLKLIDLAGLTKVPFGDKSMDEIKELNISRINTDVNYMLETDK